MADYAKLTVVKLKELLKAHSLPVSGNKAALVARLEENDAEAERKLLAEEDAAQGESNGNEAEPAEPPAAEAAPTAKPQDAPPTEEQAEVLGTQQEDVMDTRADAVPPPEPSMTAPISEEQARAEAEGASPVEEKTAIEGAVQEQEEEDTRPLDSTPPEPTQSSTQPPTTILETPNASQQLGEPLSEPTASTSQPTLDQISIQHVQAPLDTNESSIDREELVEDTRKRKRRSESPIPSSAEVATKKSKALDGSPRVTVTEGSESQEVKANGEMSERGGSGGTHDSMVTEQSPAPKPAVPESAEKSITQDSGITIDTHRQPELQESALEEEVKVKTPPPEDLKEKVLSPSRQQPNAKFKGLFAATAPSQPTAAEPESYPIEDREVEPALHPATTALYIRNFMRPLQPTALQEHLESLARPPNETGDEETIQEFFLDSIKTHCLVQFRSISAASRVRLALHDRVWPDERTRKALWVDYVPEEKIKKWVEVEQGAGGGRGAPQKRFEVVYEKENGEPVAYLQEADGTGPRASISAAIGPRNGHVPTGPRAVAPPAPQGDAGKGFKQLDDLFKSTAAKPKLYFQPVSDSVADKRLDLLAAGRGGGRSDEMRRFTFEDAMIVDKGPEYGSGWRGGHRGRGGYGRGYSSRSGYRGDSRRDSYR